MVKKNNSTKKVFLYANKTLVVKPQNKILFRLFKMKILKFEMWVRSPAKPTKKTTTKRSSNSMFCLH